MIFSYGLLSVLATVLEWDVSNYVLLGLSLFLIALGYLRKKARAKKFPMDLLLGGILGIPLILLLIRGLLFPYVEKTFWYLMDFTIIGKLDLWYGWPLLLFTLTGGTILYHLLSKRSWGRIILVLGMLTSLIAGTINYVPWNLVGIWAWIYVALHLTFEEYLLRNPQTREVPGKDKRILVLAILLVVVVLPNRTKPISWQGVIDAWNHTTAAVNEAICDVVYWGENSDFGIQSIGFSNQDHGFWGAIAHGEDREMMGMMADRRIGAEETYFIGNILDDYSDNTWSKTEENAVQAESIWNKNTDRESIPENEFNLQEKLYYLNQSGIGSSDESFFCQISRYHFEYKSLRSNTIFVPRNCVGIEVQDGQGEITSAGPNTFFTKNQKKHDRYTVTGLQMNLKNEDLIAYLRNPGTERIPDQSATTKSEADNSTLFEECTVALGLDESQLQKLTNPAMEKKIAAYEKQIKKRDLTLPNSISDKVYDLAKKITKDCDNDYDRVQAIATYLKEDGSYSYTLSPEEAPDGMEEVEYFLFEDKNGYCSHFACATAVLCRCLGIPARFVEGASISYDGEGTGTKIYGKDAHAWTEVYLSGFGWYDVDATPTYVLDCGSFTKNRENGIKGTMPEVSEPDSENTIVASGRLFVEEKLSWDTFLSYVEIVVAGVCGLLGIFFLLRRLILSYKYRHSSNRQKTEWLMKKVLLHRKNRGVGMQQNETLREYAKRLDEVDMVAFLHWYEAVRYGGAEVSNEDVENLEALWKKEKKQRKAWKRFHAKKS